MTTTTGAVRYHEGTAVVDLPAQIDSTAEAVLTDAYAAAAAHGAKILLLNFAGVEFLSSTGIALIVGDPRARPQGGPRRPGLGAQRPLQGDLRDHPPGGLHDDLRGRERGIE